MTERVAGSLFRFGEGLCPPSIFLCVMLHEGNSAESLIRDGGI